MRIWSPSQKSSLGSSTIGGSLNAISQTMKLPWRSHTGLNAGLGGGLSVFGSTGTPAATGATSESVTALATTTDRATRMSDACMPLSFHELRAPAHTTGPIHAG